MVAAIAVGLEQGDDIVEAARWGVAAGTAATLAAGTGLCRREDTERLLPAVAITPR
jgi:6-phosphofructokinase 2